MFPRHPSFEAPYAGACFSAVVTLRTIFLVFLLYVLNHTIYLGTPLGALATCAAIGTGAASFLGFTRLRAAGFLLGLALAYIGVRGIVELFSFFPADSATEVLWSFRLLTHWNLCFLVIALAGTTTWLFWRNSH